MSIDDHIEPRQFSEVFLAELLAVEARRRRQRLEQLLGKLPSRSNRELPEVRRPGGVSLPPAGPAAPIDLNYLVECHEKTKDARKELERVRCFHKGVADPENASGSATQPTAGALRMTNRRQTAKGAALDYFESAKASHKAAEQYRDRRFEAARSLRCRQPRILANPPRPSGNGPRRF